MLTAEVKTIKDTNLKLSKAILKASHKDHSKHNKGTSKKTRKEKKKKPKINDQYKGKTVPPKDNDPTKDVNGHTC